MYARGRAVICRPLAAAAAESDYGRTGGRYITPVEWSRHKVRQAEGTTGERCRSCRPFLRSPDTRLSIKSIEFETCLRPVLLADEKHKVKLPADEKQMAESLVWMPPVSARRAARLKRGRDWRCQSEESQESA